MKRRFTAALDYERCAWTIRLRGGSSDDFAQCMRQAKVGNLCTQHSKMADNFCDYCGGNDEVPPEHTADCARPIASDGTKQEGGANG